MGAAKDNRIHIVLVEFTEIRRDNQLCGSWGQTSPPRQVARAVDRR